MADNYLTGSPWYCWEQIEAPSEEGVFIILVFSFEDASSVQGKTLAHVETTISIYLPEE